MKLKYVVAESLEDAWVRPRLGLEKGNDMKLKYVVAESLEDAWVQLQEGTEVESASKADELLADVEDGTGKPHHIYRVTVEQAT